VKTALTTGSTGYENLKRADGWGDRTCRGEKRGGNGEYCKRRRESMNEVIRDEGGEVHDDQSADEPHSGLSTQHSTGSRNSTA